MGKKLPKPCYIYRLRYSAYAGGITDCGSDKLQAKTQRILPPKSGYILLNALVCTEWFVNKVIRRYSIIVAEWRKLLQIALASLF